MINNGRIEAAQRAAEVYAEQHRNEFGVTNREGGIMLQLVGIIEELKNKNNEDKRYDIMGFEGQKCLRCDKYVMDCCASIEYDSTKRERLYEFEIDEDV